MKTRILILACACQLTLTILLAVVFRGQVARADVPPARAARTVMYTDTPADRSIETARNDALADEVLRALRQWTGRSDDVLRPWADAIADNAEDRVEALRAARVAAIESRWFAPWVLDFSCNRGVWRACDNGNAVGVFQIWDKSLVGASPEEQVKRALPMLREHPERWTTRREAWAGADGWMSGTEEQRNEDEPPPDHVRVSKVPAAIVDEARAYLKQVYKEPVGTEQMIERDGKRWGLRLEWHHHPAGFVGGPNGWHKGVTVFAIVERWTS